MSETTPEEQGSPEGYQGLPWFDRVWVVLLLLVVLTATWRVILS